MKSQALKDRIIAIGFSITVILIIGLLFKKATPEPPSKNNLQSQIISVPLNPAKVNGDWKKVLVKLTLLVYPIGPPHDASDKFSAAPWFTPASRIFTPEELTDPVPSTGPVTESSEEKIPVTPGIADLDLAILSKNISNVDIREVYTKESSLHANWIDNRGLSLSNPFLTSISLEEIEAFKNLTVTGPSVYEIIPFKTSSSTYPKLHLKQIRSCGNKDLEALVMDRLKRFIYRVNLDDQFKDTYGWRKEKKTVMVIWKDVFKVKEGSKVIPMSKKDFEKQLGKDPFIGEGDWK